MASYYNGSLVPIQSIKVGPIRVVAASTAIDKGLPIDVLLNIGRWPSWYVSHRFHSRARLKPVVPSVGRASLGLGSSFDTRMTDVC